MIQNPESTRSLYTENIVIETNSKSVYYLLHFSYDAYFKFIFVCNIIRMAKFRVEYFPSKIKFVGFSDSADQVKSIDMLWM